MSKLLCDSTRCRKKGVYTLKQPFGVLVICATCYEGLTGVQKKAAKKIGVTG